MERVSLLLSEGHQFAGEYPIWLLLMESLIVSQRKDRLIATEAIAMRSAMSSLLSEGGAEEWSKTLKRLAHV